MKNFNCRALEEYSKHLENKKNETVEKPFSYRLNAFIIERTKNLKFEAVKNLNEVSFFEFKKNFCIEGKMLISSDFCKNTIFGSEKVNILFRAWHDDQHLKLNLGFDYSEEMAVCFSQLNELPTNWIFEKKLIISEIIGQALFHKKTGQFVGDQIKFTHDFLKVHRNKSIQQILNEICN